DCAYVRAGQGQKFFFVVRKNLKGADVSLEGVLLLGFVFQALRGDAPAMEVSYFGFAVEAELEPRIVSPFGRQNAVGDPAVGDDLAVVAKGGLGFVQQRHGVDVMGIFFWRAIGQAAEPVWRSRHGDGRSQQAQKKRSPKGSSGLWSAHGRLRSARPLAARRPH